MNNMYLVNFIDFLDAKANIVIWKSEKEKIFDGKVYGLYDLHDLIKNAKIKEMNTSLSSLNILVEY